MARGNARSLYNWFAFSTVDFDLSIEVKGTEIYMKQYKAFPVILISLLIIRTVMKIFISNEIDPGELGGMFFLLAFCINCAFGEQQCYINTKELRKKTLIN